MNINFKKVFLKSHITMLGILDIHIQKNTAAPSHTTHEDLLIRDNDDRQKAIQILEKLSIFIVLRQ